MLKKEHRINKTREMQKVYRKGAAMHTPALVIKFLPLAKTRIAFVVSKKVSKKAVERNRIKRALREEIRINMPHIATGEYMLIAKNTATKYENEQLRQQLMGALKKGKVWQD